MSKVLWLCVLIGMLAACGTSPQRPYPVTQYPTKEVARQEMVLEWSLDAVPSRLPSETTQRISQTRYYLFSRDGEACEVDYMVYSAVQPGDRVACHWLLPTAATESPS